MFGCGYGDGDVYVYVYGYGYVRAGCDGQVIVWSHELRRRFTIDLNRALKDDVRVFALDYSSGKLLVGTHSQTIVEIDMKSRQCRVLMSVWTSDRFCLAFAWLLLGLAGWSVDLSGIV